VSDSIDLIQSVLSLKNGLELILTFMIMLQIIYLFSYVKRSAILWSHITFLTVLFAHFILLNAYHYFEVVFMQSYLFYPMYGTCLIWTFDLLKKTEQSRKSLLKYGTFLMVGIGLVSIDYSSLFIPPIYLVSVIGYLLYHARKTPDNELGRWFRRLNFYMILLVGLFPIAYFLVDAKDYLLFKIPYSLFFIWFLMHNFSSFLGRPKFFVLTSDDEQTKPDGEVVEKIKTALVENKVYRRSVLTLHELSSEINEPTYKISKVLNQHFNKTFPELINHYRVAEIKDRLVNTNDAHLTIEALAYEAGFNTPSSFYVAFKKELGVTPKQYRKHHLLKKSA